MWRFVRYSVAGLLLLCSGAAYSQSHGLEIAPRGGVCLTSGAAGFKTAMAPTAGLELAYSFMGSIGGEAAAGIRVGAGIGYGNLSLSGRPESEFTNVDYEGHTMAYLTTADVVEKHTSMYLELPVMAALRAGGFTLNAGARLRWMVSDSYSGSLSNPLIRATYTEYGVSIENRKLTGLLSDEQKNYQGTGSLSRGTLQVGAELGYEWTIKRGFYATQNIGVSLFAYYDVLCFGSQKSAERFIDVSPIASATDPVAKVSVGSIGAMAPDIRSLQLGVRLTYAIRTLDYKRYGWHNRRRRF